MFSKKIKKRLFVALLLCGLFTLWFFNAEVFYKKIESPDGKHYAIVRSRLYESFIFMGMGQGSDKRGSIEIYTQNGKSLGKLPMPMIQFMYDIQWLDTGVDLPFVGRWEFEKGIVYHATP